MDGADPVSLILLVEDEPGIRDYVSRILTGSGYRVWTCDNGLDALALALSLRPRAVVSDVGIPGIDGAELARTLRGRPETRNARILLMSGGPEPRNRHGAAFLAKPFLACELLASLSSLMRDTADDVVNHPQC